MATIIDLYDAIDSTPIIDHHAHNLLKSYAASEALLSITTEASGLALKSSKSTLAHLRGLKNLAAVLQCGVTWDAVEAAISAQIAKPDNQWARRCFEGIQT